MVCNCSCTPLNLGQGWAIPYHILCGANNCLWPKLDAQLSKPHYSGVIMSTMASQITSLTMVYLTVYSRRRSKKTSKLRVTGLCEGNSPVTGEFPAQRASNAENVSILWRHHANQKRHPIVPRCLMHCFSPPGFSKLATNDYCQLPTTRVKGNK